MEGCQRHGEGVLTAAVVINTGGVLVRVTAAVVGAGDGGGWEHQWWAGTT